ncbi:MAG: hypothetical protein COA94_03820 [Rickettsiales bacterium]|nr:MAG: hypothetical protein COA94_03820 [Rickettsiales bacterium]
MGFLHLHTLPIKPTLLLENTDTSGVHTLLLKNAHMLGNLSYLTVRGILKKKLNATPSNWSYSSGIISPPILSFSNEKTSKMATSLEIREMAIYQKNSRRQPSQQTVKEQYRSPILKPHPPLPRAGKLKR